jgi:hypothetical protein
VHHDARGNSVWTWNETEQNDFPLTASWVLRALDVPSLGLEETAPVQATFDPYNRG